MSDKTKYAVKFVGYSAYVITRRRSREIDCAHLDFVADFTAIRADGGWVIVQNRTDLGPFLKTLPELVDELRELLRQGAGESIESSPVTTTADYVTKVLERVEQGQPVSDDRVSLFRGKNEVSITRGTDVSRFIRQITKRFTEIEKVIEQAEQIGARIKRRPYSEYIDEIGRTGLARVEYHGFGLFIGGRLVFYPDYQVALTEHLGGHTFEIGRAHV